MNNKNAVAIVVSLTIVVSVIVVSLSALTYAKADITPLIGFLSFIPTTIASLIVLKRQEEQSEVLNKVEKNTNGNLSALIERVGPVTPAETDTESENG